jgi:putative tricarboxylic transport membrane protein
VEAITDSSRARLLGFASSPQPTTAIVGPRGLPQAQIEYWENVLARVVESDDWKKMLERDLVTREFLRSARMRDELKADYEELKSVMTELGLVK